MNEDLIVLKSAYLKFLSENFITIQKLNQFYTQEGRSTAFIWFLVCFGVFSISSAISLRVHFYGYSLFKNNDDFKMLFNIICLVSGIIGFITFIMSFLYSYDITYYLG